MGVAHTWRAIQRADCCTTLVPTVASSVFLCSISSSRSVKLFGCILHNALIYATFNNPQSPTSSSFPLLIFLGLFKIYLAVIWDHWCQYDTKWATLLKYITIILSQHTQGISTVCRVDTKPYLFTSSSAHPADGCWSGLVFQVVGVWGHEVRGSKMSWGTGMVEGPIPYGTENASYECLGPPDTFRLGFCFLCHVEFLLCTPSTRGSFVWDPNAENEAWQKWSA